MAATRAVAARPLTYLMDQHGLSRGDLIPLLGTASRVSEVMTGKRELSMTMVRKLREQFHIPADLLIPPLRSSEIAASPAAVRATHRSYREPLSPVCDAQEP